MDMLRFYFYCFCSDIDFEYPSGTAQSRGFANLLTELRTAFDALAMRNGDAIPYQLTVKFFSYVTVRVLLNKALFFKGRGTCWIYQLSCPTDGFCSDLLEFDGM
jgi:GH18 family chitinase